MDDTTSNPLPAEPGEGLASLSSLILSLTIGALQQMGIDPTGKQTGETNLENAKQTIDLIEMLKEKTRGNTTPDEEELFSGVLTDLRVRFLRLQGKSGDKPEAEAGKTAEPAPRIVTPDAPPKGKIITDF